MKSKTLIQYCLVGVLSISIGFLMAVISDYLLTFEPTLASSTPTYSISSGPNSKILVNGAPFFINGFYYYNFSHYTNFLSDAQQSSLLQDLNSKRLNSLYMTLDYDNPTLPGFLDTANSLGMKLMVSYDWPPSLSDTYHKVGTNLTAIRNAGKASAMIVQLADDMNDPARFVPADIMIRNNFVKGISTNFLTYGSGTGRWTSDIVGYIPYLDIFGYQSYPVGNSPTKRALEQHFQYSANTREKTAGTNTAVIANLQAFAWNNVLYPTAEEYRNMFFASLINDVSGIVPWRYRDDTYNVTTANPALWQEILSLNNDFAAIETVIENGNWSIGPYDPVGVSPMVFGDIRYAKWDLGGSTYIIAINTNETTQKTTTISLSQAFGQLENLYANNSRYGSDFSLINSGQQVSLNLAPRGVAVMKATGSPVVPPTPPVIPPTPPVTPPTPPVVPPTVPPVIPPVVPPVIPPVVPPIVPPTRPPVVISTQVWQQRANAINSYINNWAITKERRINISLSIIERMEITSVKIASLGIDITDLNLLIAQYKQLSIQADSKFDFGLNSLNAALTAIASKNNDAYKEFLDKATLEVKEAQDLYLEANNLFKDQIAVLMKQKLVEAKS